MSSSDMNASGKRGGRSRPRIRQLGSKSNLKATTEREKSMYETSRVPQGTGVRAHGRPVTSEALDEEVDKLFEDGFSDLREFL